MCFVSNIAEAASKYGCHPTDSADPLDPVIFMIRELMRVEKIFLLDSYVVRPKDLGLGFDLFILIEAGSEHPMSVYERRIEDSRQDDIVVNASVYKISVVQELLKKGNLYFRSVCDSRKIIYDSGHVELQVGRSTVNPVRRELLVADFRYLQAKAKSFLSGARGYRENQDYQLAAFMLHQVFEHGLNALLTPLMGYRIQTHNLNTLFLHAGRFSNRFRSLFPRDTDAEIGVYQTLHKAYIHGRYKNRFQVGEETVHLLIDRADRLLEMTNGLFFQQVNLLFPEDPAFINV